MLTIRKTLVMRKYYIVIWFSVIFSNISTILGLIGRADKYHELTGETNQPRVGV